MRTTMTVVLAVLLAACGGAGEAPGLLGGDTGAPAADAGTLGPDAERPADALLGAPGDALAPDSRPASPDVQPQAGDSLPGDSTPGCDPLASANTCGAQLCRILCQTKPTEPDLQGACMTAGYLKGAGGCEGQLCGPVFFADGSFDPKGPPDTYAPCGAGLGCAPTELGNVYSGGARYLVQDAPAGSKNKSWVGHYACRRYCRTSADCGAGQFCRGGFVPCGSDAVPKERAVAGLGTCTQAKDPACL